MNRFFISIFCVFILWSCNSSKAPVTTTTPVVMAPKISITQSFTDYWQQHVDYKMEIDMDVNTYQYQGKQQLVYTNNSPDVLNRVYYHLYFNAFQPGSEMDVRSLTIADPDRRVKDRISKLKPNEIGYIKVNSLKQNGVDLKHETVGTVLEVDLAKPIQPGESVTFDMLFDAQVPVQIRRSGRKNSEGVDLSMAQWYPKLAEYDFEGWHADPYIGREFFGVWGDFDVKITIDKNYVIGGTGYLQNPNSIGYGYETGVINRPNTDKLTWHFKAPNVHDFTWAADPEYIHDTMQVPNGPLLHFFYKGSMPKEKLNNWKKLQPKTVELMKYFSEHIGAYPYEQYSVIQGGDGGMEYAMCTLLLGEGTLDGLVYGVIVHELAHTWFQFLLASNELKHEWMDEGFASYIEYQAIDAIKKTQMKNPYEKGYSRYISLARSGLEQPLTTHADRYNMNAIYSTSAYYKGEVFLAQLGYIIGEDQLKQTIKKYFTDFSFKHPKPLDIIRTAEKISGLELDWYLMDFAQTTNTIDYGVKAIEDKTITLERIGLMPMPIDLKVTYTDNSTEDFYIPLQMMRGEKPTSATLIKDWAWAYPTYTFEASKTIRSVEIDPSGLMADIDRTNNKK
jgi:hypothetical protein